MKAINEALLGAWLHLSTNVVNHRMVSELSYNEALICNILFRETRNNPQHPLTATDLCRETKMLKSQMNRTLGQLEARGLIHRERSTEDKRCILVFMNPEQLDTYHAVHQKILNLVDGVVAEIGEAKAKLITDLMEEISAVVDQLQPKQEPKQ